MVASQVCCVDVGPGTCTRATAKTASYPSDRCRSGVRVPSYSVFGQPIGRNTGTVALRLKSAYIRKFKRLVDLTINDLPPEAKLIVILGPNACGKSSLFDAFQRRLKVEQLFAMSDELMRYYRRTTSEAVAEQEEVRFEFHGGDPSSLDDLKRSLYVRSAYRHDPSFQNTTIQQQPNVLDRHAVWRLIDTDQTVQSMLPEDYLASSRHGDNSWTDDRRYHRRHNR